MESKISHLHLDASHDPENAEHELKIAYNCVIETGVTHLWNRMQIPGVNPEEVVTYYKNAMEAYQKNDRLLAERWARTAKHLAKACWHEAKISYLKPRIQDLEWLSNASEEYNLHEHSDTTNDLLESLERQIPTLMTQTPEAMRRYILQGKKHLSLLQDPKCQHELLRAEHIKAAHEYGRTIECLLLAFEASLKKKKLAA